MKKIRKRRVAALAATLVALASATIAGAAIIGASGQVEVIPPPASVKLHELESDAVMRAFDEGRSVLLTMPLCVDITEPGVYDELTDLTPGCIPSGTTVSGVFLHADKVGDSSPQVWLEGAVENDSELAGIAVLDRSLDRSDHIGAAGTLYPTGAFGRGLKLDPADNGDSVEFGPDRRTIALKAGTSWHAGQTRGVKVECKCTNIDIDPKETKDANNKITSPTAGFGLKASDKGVKDNLLTVDVDVEWLAKITCEGDKGGCSATYDLGASSTWTIDGNPAKVVTQAHKSGKVASIACKGKCKGDQPQSPKKAPVSEYTAEVQKLTQHGKPGGSITGNFTGTIELTLTPRDCDGKVATVTIRVSGGLQGGNMIGTVDAVTTVKTPKP